MSAPRKITAWGTGRKMSLLGGSPEFQHLYHHDDVVRELRKALEEIVEHCRNSGRGCAAVNDRIYERCEETAMEALAKIAQEG